jgi:hypothetical protein
VVPRVGDHDALDQELFQRRWGTAEQLLTQGIERAARSFPGRNGSSGEQTEHGRLGIGGEVAQLGDKFRLLVECLFDLG